jgi:hypothetical protein
MRMWRIPMMRKETADRLRCPKCRHWVLAEDGVCEHCNKEV